MIITIGAKKGKTREGIMLGKRRKVSNRMCLFGEMLNVWCSMASAAVVGATMVRAAAAGATEVDGTSGVMYGAVVVGGMDGVLLVCCMVQQ